MAVLQFKNMKKFILFFVIGFLFYKFILTNKAEFPEVVSTVGTQETIRYTKFMANNTLIEEVAVYDEATIIEVYAPSCPACKQFDRNYKLMKKERPDVNLVKLNLSDDFLKGTLSAETKASMRENNICYTPHIIVVDSMGEVIAADNCKKNGGANFFIDWLNTELNN